MQNTFDITFWLAGEIYNADRDDNPLGLIPDCKSSSNKQLPTCTKLGLLVQQKSICKWLLTDFFKYFLIWKLLASKACFPSRNNFLTLYRRESKQFTISKAATETSHGNKRNPPKRKPSNQLKTFIIDEHDRSSPSGPYGNSGDSTHARPFLSSLLLVVVIKIRFYALWWGRTWNVLVSQINWITAAICFTLCVSNKNYLQVYMNDNGIK